MNIGYHKFSASGDYFVYDTTTNHVHEVDSAVYQILDEYLKNDLATFDNRFKEQSRSEMAFRKAIDDIKSLKENDGLFRPFFKKDFSEYLDIDLIKEAQSRHLRHLLLGVTEQCNQRCTYCVYSGDYIGRRHHSNRLMTWETARLSIDYFLDRAKNYGFTAITFYGGEPLLNWDLIKRSILHIHEHNTLNNLRVSIGTNATLLTDDKIDFCMGNDINLFISFDGPPHIHNRSRIYRNGKGTHTRVFHVLQKIKKKSPTYFQKHVHILSTFDYKDDLLEIFRYFSEDFFQDVRVRLKPIKDLDTDTRKFSDRDRTTYENSLDNLIDMYLGNFQNKSAFNYLLFFDLFSGVFKSLVKRNIEIADSSQRPNKTCIPGVSQLFVSADGQFYTCNHFCAPGLQIGNCYDGVDAKKVKDLLEVYIGYCNEMCQECWAYRLCRLCFVHLFEKGKMSKERKIHHCIREKKRIARDLKRYMYILENEPEVANLHKLSLRSRIRAHQSKNEQIHVEGNDTEKKINNIHIRAKEGINMSRIKIKDIPKDRKISQEEMKKVIGGNVGVAGLQECSVVKEWDKATPQLMQAVCSGEKLPAAEIEYVTVTNSGESSNFASGIGELSLNNTATSLISDDD